MEECSCSPKKNFCGLWIRENPSPKIASWIRLRKGTGIFWVHPWRFTLGPENQPLETEIPIGDHHFQVPAVKLWGCTLQNVSTDSRFLASQVNGLDFASLKIQMYPGREKPHHISGIWLHYVLGWWLMDWAKNTLLKDIAKVYKSQHLGPCFGILRG